MNSKEKRMFITKESVLIYTLENEIHDIGIAQKKPKKPL
jgi:methanogenic corrinoid protein MtbC1